MNFDPKNILIINFGQIGDVIYSLPALQAIKKKFPNSKITIAIGKSTRSIIEMSGLFDEIITVDRVKLRDSNKLWSIKQIIKIIFDIRKRKFDFVIDLHSLSETNLLGFISGAKLRLYANRGTRSLDFLSNFRPKPPPLDQNLHITDYYLRNLEPIGVKNVPRHFQIPLPLKESEKVEKILKADIFSDKEQIGINLGAGNTSRSWEIDNFAQLSQELSANPRFQVLVFFGPEEKPFENEIRAKFPSNVLIYNQFNLQELAVAFSYLKLLIGNDTGPMHLGANVGTPVLLITDPKIFMPINQIVHFVKTGKPNEVSVEEVIQTMQSLI